jgi:hypothetical protein
MLGRCIVNAPGLQARLVDLLRPRDDADRSEGVGRLEAVVTEALVVVCHERKPSVHVGEFTAGERHPVAEPGVHSANSKGGRGQIETTRSPNCQAGFPGKRSLPAERGMRADPPARPRIRNPHSSRTFTRMPILSAELMHVVHVMYVF